MTPGFIETHTHFDGAMGWQPELDPLAGYGVTSLVMGNCGFSLVPAPEDPAFARGRSTAARPGEMVRPG